VLHIRDRKNRALNFVVGTHLASPVLVWYLMQLLPMIGQISSFAVAVKS
jgi:hypothetical protein